ncbi:class I SAM-dependent methyltransferase [Solibacillus sp. FSL H8-0523]|uniref:class I SAM-dependent methyltransferase n=1 Tax=Solibacillus sp. FSL H8-0523 TaxID=2954511 RepID=UPI0031014F9C
MAFSKEWEEVYQNQNHLSIWPWSDVVSYVKRHTNASGSDFKVLELGCGAGANIPFFKSLNVEYHAIDGSPSIVEKLHTQFPEYKNNIQIGDFTKLDFGKNKYDLILDRASITHNTTRAINECLANVYKALKNKGTYIGIDWFSSAHSDFNKGSLLENDLYTKTGFTEGQFSGLGNVHFSDKDHLMKLFSAFEIKVLEHKVSNFELPKQHQFASWNIVATKVENSLLGEILV